ncbi:MAG: hypothetical protein U0795_17655 [Pirellulales bacterium]
MIDARAEMHALTSQVASSPWTVTRFAWSAVLVVLSMFGVAPRVSAGEKQTFQVVEVDRQVLSEQILTPPEVPGHSLISRVQRQKIQAPTNPEYDGADVLIYVQDERVQGVGSARGVTVDTLKNGDKVFWTFQSKSKRVEKEGGSWEVTFEGTGEIVGGTGKYKNAKGHETFSGTVTPDSTNINTQITWEY